MSVTISDVRDRIRDFPYPRPKFGESPELLGKGDAATVSFQMSKTPYTGSSLASGQGTTIWQSTTPGVWTQVTSGFTIAGNMVTFTTAPATGTLIGARYFITGFTDSSLTTMLTQAQASPVCTSDDMILYKCQYDSALAQLQDRELLLTMHRGDISDDTGQYAAALGKLAERLERLLFGKNRPGANVATAVVAYGDLNQYSPRR